MPRFAWALFAALLLAGGAVGMESGGASSSGGGASSSGGRGWDWSMYEGHMGFTVQEWERWYGEHGGGQHEGGDQHEGGGWKWVKVRKSKEAKS